MLDAERYRFSYPVQQYPVKVTSFNLDKTPLVEGVLQGIKGQYLLLDTGVINIRKFTAYQVERFRGQVETRSLTFHRDLIDLRNKPSVGLSERDRP